VDGVDDFARVDRLQVGRRGAEVGVPELALDDVDWDPLTGEFDRVRVPQLVLVPTSAQASLCRSGGYADLVDKVSARWDVGWIDVGITRVFVVILP
jgi:hypothetical protein